MVAPLPGRSQYRISDFCIEVLDPRGMMPFKLAQMSSLRHPGKSQTETDFVDFCLMDCHILLFAYPPDGAKMPYNKANHT